jgi:hypothetical protein
MNENWKIGELFGNIGRILLGKKMIIAKSQKDLDKDARSRRIDRRSA